MKVEEEILNSLSKACVAEFIGTFVLVFWGSAAVALTPTAAGPVVPALAHGFAIVFAAYALGHWSGAHINPAVTISVWLVGGIEARKALAYIVTQVIAAVVAAAVLNVILSGQAASFGAFSFEVSTSSALLLEMILTFCLATVVLQAAVAGKAGNMAGLAIGLTLAGCILAGGALTGASVNPARTLGPAIVAGQLGQVWVYLVGTILGGILAALVSRFVLTEKQTVS